MILLLIGTFLLKQEGKVQLSLEPPSVITYYRCIVPWHCSCNMKGRLSGWWTFRKLVCTNLAAAFLTIQLNIQTIRLCLCLENSQPSWIHEKIIWDVKRILLKCSIKRLEMLKYSVTCSKMKRWISLNARKLVNVEKHFMAQTVREGRWASPAATSQWAGLDYD